jgi:hypothetical protein
MYPAVPSCTHTLVICAAYARHIPGTRRVLGGYYPGTTRVLPGVLLAPTPQQFPSLKSFTQWTGWGKWPLVLARGPADWRRRFLECGGGGIF